MDPFASRSPYDGTEFKSYSAHSSDELTTRLKTCQAAQQIVKQTAFSARGDWFMNAAAILREKTDRFAALMTEEMGKPIDQARAEVTKCAWVCEHYAECGEDYLESTHFSTDTSTVTIEYAPLGVILAIMPWNFPFWQLFRCAAPIVMGGNTILMKHAANVPRCALAIESIFKDAGFPDGTLLNAFAEHTAIPDIIGSPQIAGVTLTGSTRAGKIVAQEAGRHLKPCVLELGGSDPYVVFDDADLDVAVAACVTGRLQNCGQSCIATKRILVHSAIARNFEQRLLAIVKTKRVGDPMDPTTDVGPLARPDLADGFRRQVDQSVVRGATVLYQSSVPDGDCFVPISILKDVTRGMPAWDEELFGPAFALREFDSTKAAIVLANDSPYGLGAAVFTQDATKASTVAAALECGNVAINDMVKSDPRYPFGGIKESGFGRELGAQGIRAFMSVKTTCRAI